MADPKARGVHLVGSLRFPDDAEDATFDPPDAKSVFTFLVSALPGRCRRVPDGEPASRNDFINCQDTVFARSPWVFNDYERSKRSIAIPEDASSREIELDPVHYDDWAHASWLDFRALNPDPDPAGPRFQVCLPSPVNVIARFVHPDYQVRVEPMYEAMLLGAVGRIQERIEHGRLAIQFDCALEFAFLENIVGPGGMWAPWFEVSVESLAERVARVAKAVQPGVELGLHLCYGDMYHRHFVEPKDAGLLVRFANAVAERVGRPLDFVHLPVPKERHDEGYFAPLGDLRIGEGAEIYLGLVHAHDLEGTRRRMEAAGKVVQGFGVATECGLGRTPPKDVGSVIEILNAVSEPV